MINQAFGFHMSALVLVLAKNGNECLGEGAFGKQAAQQVWKLEGNEEGIRQHACAESAGDDKVANESEYAGEQRHAADGNEGFEKIHSAVSVGATENATS